MKKEIYHLQEPPVDPFMVKLPSDLDDMMIKRYAYCETESYKQYRKRERRSIGFIIVTILILIGIIILLATVPAETIDTFLQ